MAVTGFNLTEYVERDYTPFTEDQLSFLRGTYPLIIDTWVDFSKDGVEICRQPSRFAPSIMLVVDGFMWMGTTPCDLLDHRKILEATGDVILTGLGLGLGVLFASLNPQITSITVVELDQRVIDYVWPMVKMKLSKPAKIIKANADEFVCLPGQYSFAFLDHAADMPPIETMARFKDTCQTVVVWREEFSEVLSSWR
jgi:hypothetical protein